MNLTNYSQNALLILYCIAGFTLLVFLVTLVIGLLAGIGLALRNLYTLCIEAHQQHN